MATSSNRYVNPDVVCERRILTLAIQQMSEFSALRTENDKVEMRKQHGLKETKNPMLSVHADLYRLGNYKLECTFIFSFFFVKGRAYQWKYCTQLYLVHASMCSRK